MKIQEIYSPNFNGKKRTKKLIKFIIIHYTGMQSERESIKRLCNLNSKVSSHYLINKKGKIYNLINDKRVAWHAGKSCWLRFKNLNKHSIGIELVNKGHHLGYEKFEKKQIQNLIKLCKKLIKKYKIKKKNIIGHSDIAPSRKIDPGEKFPWKQLYMHKIGIWHDQKPKVLLKLRRKKILKKKEEEKFFINLKKIGYCFPFKNKKFLTKTIKAFQRHFRRELINGVLDQECYEIAKSLTKKA